MRRGRKALAVILSLAVLCTCIIVGAAGESPNLVKGILPAQNFTSATSGNLATVTDGRVTTDYGWTLRGDYHGKANPIMCFDLGSPQKIGKVVVIGSNNYMNWEQPAKDSYKLATNYDILYSDDENSNINAKKWTVAKEVRNNSVQYSTSEFSNITARFWAINVKLADVKDRARIVEVEMYEGEDVVLEKPEISIISDKFQVYAGEALPLEIQATCKSSEVTSVEILENDVTLMSATKQDDKWRAILTDLAVGEHIFTIRATTEAGGTAEIEKMVSVVEKGIYNVALHKSVTAYPEANLDVDSDPLYLVNGKTDDFQKDRWYVSDDASSTAYAEIDLANGTENMFLLDHFSMYSGTRDDDTATDVFTDFTVSYYNGSEWKDAKAVTGANSLYEFDFDENIIASKIKITSNQNVKFLVRELEISGQAYIEEGSLEKKSFTITDAFGAPMEIFTANEQVNISADIKNGTFDDIAMTAVLAIKEKDGRLIAADAVNKNIISGTTEAFTMRTTIPGDAEQPSVEVYWLDIAKLVPLLETDRLYSKGKSIYDPNEIVLQVEENNFKVFIKGEDEYSDDYVAYNFRRVTNDAVDLYRIYGVYKTERTGEESFEAETAENGLLTNVEVEFAAQEKIDGSPAADFVGGFHEDEFIEGTPALSIDGTAVEMDKSGIYTGQTIRFVQNSYLNSCNSTTKIANHCKDYSITAENGVVLDQTVDWIKATDLLSYYYLMFPVKTISFEKIEYMHNGEKFVSKLDGNALNPPINAPGTQAYTVYGRGGEFKADIKLDKMQNLPTVKPLEFFVAVRDGDVKIYLGQYNDPVTVSEGTQWKWQNTYNLTLADPRSSAKVKLSCDNQYDVNERAEVYVTAEDMAIAKAEIYDGGNKIGDAVPTEDGYFFD